MNPGPPELAPTMELVERRDKIISELAKVVEDRVADQPAATKMIDAKPPTFSPCRSAILSVPRRRLAQKEWNEHGYTRSELNDIYLRKR
jgi:hypothetical protein